MLQGPQDPLRLACRGASGLAASALLVLLLLAAPLGTLAQGLRFAPGRLGASVVQKSITNWKSILNQSTTIWSGPNWQAARTSSRCAVRSSATLCGVDISNTAAANKAALLVAASPAAYDTRVSDQVGGFAAAPAPWDQYDCNACVAMAVAAAADAAVAMALGRANPGPLISARSLFFCADASSAGPNCGEGWELVSALNGLEKRKGIPTDACLPFLDSDTLSRLSDQETCTPKCKNTVEGTLSYTNRVRFDNIWKIQSRIRQNGAVVTRMWVPTGFQEFYKQPENRQKVWTTDQQSSSNGGFNHAVVLAGYNNTGGWWLIWSSWGKDWGDSGFARVQFGKLDLADPSSTFGVNFSPSQPSPAPALDVTLDRSLPNCYWYTVNRQTYLSKVASDLGMDLAVLISLNRERLPDLGAWLKPGFRLQACNINLARSCTGFDNCYSCERTPGCAWCIESSDIPDEKPKCVAAGTDLCSRTHEGGKARCPVDAIAGVTGMAGVRCADLENCRECLRYTYQCRWCTDGSADGYPGCQNTSGQCKGWYGYSSKACPKDGDPGAIQGSSCGQWNYCSACTLYGGKSAPQCTWCVTGPGTGTCVYGRSSNQLCKSTAAASKQCPSA